MIPGSFDQQFIALAGLKGSPFPWQRALYEEFLKGNFPCRCRFPGCFCPGLIEAPIIDAVRRELRIDMDVFRGIFPRPYCLLVANEVWRPGQKGWLQEGRYFLEIPYAHRRELVRYILKHDPT